MKLVVCSHKLCWRSPSSPSGYATDGGFPFQIAALSELFDRTTVLVPCIQSHSPAQGLALGGHEVIVVPLRVPKGRASWRKALFPLWTASNAPVLIRELGRADAVHAPIPGDIGTVGMLLALLLRKPLFVRHCGNWFMQRTAAERFWRWFMERFAGGKNVMLATGVAASPPSPNRAVKWIFATSLKQHELTALGKLRNVPSDGEIRLNITCRQDPEKGSELVVESLPLLAERFPEVRLDVVGDGDALPRLKEVATKSGVVSRVSFHGGVEHSRVLDLLDEAHLFCYPTSASDGFPKVVLEALACGLPVVATPTSALPHLLETGAGFVLSKRSPEALADAVCRCLSNAERYRAMSAKALETSRAYSLERWRQTLGEILQAAWGPLRADG